MLPIIASANTFNFQTPLINTVTPGTSVVHVPPDNVAPSVSSPQADNNSQSNVIFAQDAEQADAAPSPPSNAPAQDSGGSFSSLLQSSGSTPPAGVQAAFVAQLAAQDSGPQTQVILVQYEQLVANSNVKYLPSNASKPVDEPANTFTRILQAEKAPAPVTPSPQPPAPAPAATASSNTQTSAQATIEITASLPATPPAPAPRSSKAQNNTADNAPAGNTPASSNSTAISAVGAYATTAMRVDSLNTTAMELV